MTKDCLLCGNEAPLRFRARDFNCKISDEVFDYFRCCSCGLIFLSPIPDNLGKYYRGDYIAYSIPSSREELAARAEKMRFRIELVQKFVASGRLLEVGSSYGGFAFLAKRAGFEVEAIEMDERCCRFLSDVVGVRAINHGDINAALANSGRYNVVALWHVLEHLPNPWTTLDLLTKRLLPKSILVISTPNPDSSQFKLFGRFWVHVDAPRHLELIPAPVLIRFMQARELVPVLSTTTDEDGLALNQFGWCQSLRNLSDLLPARSGAGAENSWIPLSSRKLLRYPMHLAAQVIGNALSPLERIGWRGSAYTIVFQKTQQAPGTG